MPMDSSKVSIITGQTKVEILPCMTEGKSPFAPCPVTVTFHSLAKDSFPLTLPLACDFDFHSSSHSLCVQYVSVCVRSIFVAERRLVRRIARLISWFDHRSVRSISIVMMRDDHDRTRLFQWSRAHANFKFEFWRSILHAHAQWQS